MTSIFAAPTTEAAVQEAVQDALGSGTPLRIRGGDTRGLTSGDLAAIDTLDMGGLTGITRYEPGGLTLEARAGTPMAEIEAALAAENQMLAFEPMDHRALLGRDGSPTIGGVVSGNISGPRRVQSGACRDMLLGLRFVDGHGRLIRNGGRVMKNVTGLDLTRLLCGAHGTLGVITEVALKVLPRPECGATLCFDGLTLAEATALFCQALVTPYEVSGAAWQDGNAYLRVEGLEAQVGYRCKQLSAHFASAGPALLRDAEHDALWQAIRDVHTFRDSPDSVWKLSLKATDAPQVATLLQERVQARILLDHGGSTLWAAVPTDAPDQATTIRDLLPGNGHARLVRGAPALSGHVPVFHPEPAPIARLSDALRRQFDPDRLFNPGLMAA